MTDAPNQPRPAAMVLLWAAYLAASWTWCIGMFLPVLLARDYGPVSFAAFAVPNVIGAAIMGWVLARRGDSERFVRTHAGMCLVFSVVTIAFQAFFLAWLVGVAVPAATTALAVSAAAAAAIALLTNIGRASPLALTTLAMAVSLAAGAILLARGDLSIPPPATDPAATGRLLWLAPVCVFGFAFCPYLDLTFHRARQSLAGPAGTAAFGVGFGVLFLANILFTLGYAGIVQPMAAGSALASSLALSLVAAHIVVQLIVTCDLHGREAAAISRSRGRGLAIGAVLVGGAAGLLAPRLPTHAGLIGPEIVYRCFMAFYGLLFPAYIWICALSGAGPSRRSLRIWAFAVGVAAPMFWMGFIEGREVWLGPGLLIVLLARLAARRSPAPAPQPTA